MNRTRDVVLMGTGAFAGALARAFAQRATGQAVVHVVSRDPGRARDLCTLANAHATLAGTRARFSPHRLDPAGGDDLRPLLAETRPRVLAVCASDQSPSEARTAPSAWTDLLRRAGFGVTLPLQAALALRAASASADVDEGTAVINACFPDVVNAVVQAAGVPVLCGLGNVSTLAVVLRDVLRLREESRLKLLAHHAHLHAPPTPGEDALAWLDDRPLAVLPEALEQARSQPRAHLNEIGAAAGAAVLDTVVHETNYYVGHVPGPHGRPGGYPVTITGRSLALRLPPGMSERQAIAWNHARSDLDGVTVDQHGKAHLTPAALRVLRDHWPDVPTTFGPQDLDDLRAQQLRLRRHLRDLPAPATAERR
ncbi:hypothetical protein AB0395_22680 [Streptosporangium sp. NPDC051023]|uniref:hypothetical protein n=1 Tax=Streptosporangium sp. NPDC051023 TaxID=3155410 RepID=UPI00344C133E